MTRNKTFLLFVPVALALALLLGVNWTIHPVQASGALEKASAVIPGSLAQIPKLERVTVRAEGDQINAPEAACSVPASPPDYTGRVVYFPLDENAGATSFVSNVGSLTLTGTCTGDTCPTKTNGRVQGAFAFDGGDQVTVPYNAVTDWGPEDDFSLEVWVKLSAACVEREVFLGKYRGSDLTNYNSWWVGCEAGTNQAVFNLRSSGFITTSVQVDTDALTISGGPALNDGKWHHVVAVHNAISETVGTTLVLTDTNSLYIDGSEVASEDHNYLDDFSSDGDLNIGWYNALGSFYQYQGTLDEVAIYNQVLSPDQILKHWQANCNEAPIAVDDTLVTDENTPLTIQVATLKANDSDPNGDSFTLTAGGNTAQGGTVAPTGNGPWTYTPKADFSGTDTFIYTATDPRGASDTATVTVTVTGVNHLPLITNPGAKSSNEGDTVDLQVTATDPDAGQVLTYSALNLPPGLSINTASGRITGTISFTAFQVAPYKVKVTVTDNYTPPASAFVEFDWTVSDTNRAPQVTNPGGKTNQVGDTVNLPIVASDADGDSLAFSVTGLPEGLNIVPTTGVISGTIAATAEGSYTVKVTVTDGKNPVTVEFTWTIEIPSVDPNPKVYLPLLLREASLSD